MKLIRSLFLATCFLSVALAQPVVNFAGNAASYDTDVARGSMVVLIGTGMGPESIQIGQFPLMTAFAGTSVEVTVNGVTTEGILYYTSATQVAFVLDSDTPAGTGTVTVTYNSQTSAPFEITVVENNVGFYTLDSSGTGAGVVTFHESVNVSNPFVGETNAVNPGDLVILWGNGLGPVPFDETIGAEFLNMTDVPLQVFVNGQPVETIYQGRSPGCCTSVDNIYFNWPQPTQAAALSEGKAQNSCGSTVRAQIGDFVSNTIIVPSANVGTRTCTNDVPDPGGEPASPIDSILTQADIDRFMQNGKFSFGFVGLTRDTNYERGFDGTTVERLEDGIGIFAEFNQDIPGALEGINQLLGSTVCTTDVATSDGSIDYFGVDFRSLNAGPGIQISGPNGQQTLPQQAFAGFIFYASEEGFPLGFLTQGTYNLASSGGPDVQAFNVAAQVSSPLNWTNREQLLTVNRSAGFTATWEGPTSGWVTVSGESSSFSGTGFTIKSFSCTAPATQRSLTVPGNIASVVDPSNAAAFQFGQLSVDAFQLFELPGTGLDASVVAVTDAITQDMEYQ